MIFFYFSRPVIDVEEAPVLQAVDGVLSPGFPVDGVPLLVDGQRGDSLHQIRVKE